MANRHLARTLALQSLFEWDFYDGKVKLEEVLQQVKKEFAPEFEDEGFALDILHSVVNNQKEIDAMIQEFAPEWPLDQITTIDRNVLRIGIQELKFNPDIPPKVAINEAIELAKTFGGGSSGKFVNGVLGSIYKKMVTEGEKQDLKSQGVAEESSGGFIFRKEGDKIYAALVLDAYGKWTYYKGHVDKGETAEQAAKREASEEFGIKKINILDRIGDMQLKVHKPDGDSFRKLVHLFVAETDQVELTIPKVAELKDGKWFEVEEAQKTIGYEESLKFFNEALEIFKKKS